MGFRDRRDQTNVAEIKTELFILADFRFFWRENITGRLPRSENGRFLVSSTFTFKEHM